MENKLNKIEHIDIDDKIWEIISSKFNKEELTPSDSSLLEEWLNSDVNNLNLYLRLNDFYNKQSIRQQINVENAYSKVKHKINKIRLKKYLLSFSSAAAVLIILISVLLINNKHPHYVDFDSLAIANLDNSKDIIFQSADGNPIIITKKEFVDINKKDFKGMNVNGVLHCISDKSLLPDKQNIIKTPSMTDYSLILSDGSKVTLNANSYLSFPSKFANNERRVSLQGEALFEVAKDSKKPFIVDVKGMDVKVIGTFFDVKAYKDDENILTTLVNGRVKIIPHGVTEKESIDLYPSEQFSYNRITHRQIIREVDPYIYTAWADDIFMFKNRELRLVMQDLERWYGIKYRFEDDKAGSIKISGSIHRDKDVSNILEMISKLMKVSIKHKNDCYVITSK